MWIPIDQTLAAVDQSFVVHFHEDFDHRIVKIWAIFMAGARVTLRACHGEGCAVPIAGGAQAFELVYNCPARLLFPLPDFFQKLLAAQSHAARFAPVCQLPLNDHLRGNARMVCPGLPKGVKAAHPVPAHQDILQSIVEGMKSAEELGLEPPQYEVLYTMENSEGLRQEISSTQYVDEKWWEKKEWRMLSELSKTIKV